MQKLPKSLLKKVTGSGSGGGDKPAPPQAKSLPITDYFLENERPDAQP